MKYDYDEAVVPEILDENLLHNKERIDVLIQSILSGPDPIMNESEEEWLSRIDDYAKDLSGKIYN